jgi:hypothetical protein
MEIHYRTQHWSLRPVRDMSQEEEEEEWTRVWRGVATCILNDAFLRDTGLPVLYGTTCTIHTRPLLSYSRDDNVWARVESLLTEA